MVDLILDMEDTNNLLVKMVQISKLKITIFLTPRIIKNQLVNLHNRVEKKLIQLSIQD